MNRVFPAKEDSIVRAFLMTSEVPKGLYVANNLLNLCLYQTFLLAIFVDKDKVLPNVCTWSLCRAGPRCQSLTRGRRGSGSSWWTLGCCWSCPSRSCPAVSGAGEEICYRRPESQEIPHLRCLGHSSQLMKDLLHWCFAIVDLRSQINRNRNKQLS